MKRMEIDALVRAHRGRAHPVASLHILRQNAIEPDDQAFLCEHARELTIPDLLIWRKRSASGFTGAVIREFARIAIEDPLTFKHELLDAPRFALLDEEWIELADLTRGKVPADSFERILTRGIRNIAELPKPESVDVQEDLAGFLEDALGDFDPAPPVMSPGFIDAASAPEVILERAKNAWSAEERAILLEWLSSQGLSRKPLFEVATTALKAGENDPRLRGWLADQLTTRASWEAHGVDVVLALLDRQAFSELSALVTQIWGNRQNAEKTSKGLLDAMMMALALGFIHVIREALTASLPEKALVYLSALACLDLPTRLSRTIHDLLRAPGSEGEVRTLIEMNVRLVKHNRGREPSFEDIVAAIHCLADATA